MFAPAVEFDTARAQPTILTSSRAMGNWMGIFSDPVIAGTILDQLTHQVQQIQL